MGGISKELRIRGITQVTGHLFHQNQGMVEPGIHHRIAIGIDIAVIFAALAFGQSRSAGMRPVYDIADGGRPVDGSQEFGRLQTRGGADETVFGAQIQQGPLFQQGVMRTDKTVISGKHPVVPGDGNGLQDPFGGPGGMIQQMGQRPARGGEFAIGRVVAELVDERIGLVGNPLTVAVNVIACK